VQTQQQITNTARDLDVTDYGSDLARMEQRIRMAEARTDADRQLQADDGQDVDGTFDTNERNAKIDDELEALKQRMSGSGGSGGSSASGGGGESPRGDGGSDTQRIGMAQGGQ
jgi:phage shock protein A